MKRKIKKIDKPIQKKKDIEKFFEDKPKWFIEIMNLKCSDFVEAQKEKKELKELN